MWKVKVSYSVELSFPALEDAQRAMEILFEGGLTEVTIVFEEVK